MIVVKIQTNSKSVKLMIEVKMEKDDLT